MIEFKTKIANPEHASVLDIEPRELWEKRDRVKMVDVRRPDEWSGELGHIEGAELITLDTLPGRLGELSAEDTIVFVCRSGARSGRAAAFAQENGFENVYNMKGGMLAWNGEGLAVEKE